MLSYSIYLPTNLNKQTISANSKIIHTTIVQGYLSTLQPNKLLNKSPPDIHPSESSLDRRSRCTLSQLRAGKSSLLQSYLNHINPATYPSPICPICNIRPHDTHHLFDCPQIPTTLTTLDLWQNPVGVADLLTTWRARLSRPWLLRLASGGDNALLSLGVRTTTTTMWLKYYGHRNKKSINDSRQYWIQRNVYCVWKYTTETVLIVNLVFL